MPSSSRSHPIDPLSIAPNYFSLNGLESSFELLREHHPALALRVQNLIAEARIDHHQCSEEKQLPLDMNVSDVSAIVTALASIAEQSANSALDGEDTMISIHQTLLDWLLYAQSFLPEDTDPDDAYSRD